MSIFLIVAGLFSGAVLVRGIILRDLSVVLIGICLTALYFEATP